MAKERKQRLLDNVYHARQLADKGVPPSDEDFMKAYPVLWELLVESWLDPEHKVEAGQLLIYNSQGDWAFKAISPGLRASKVVLVSRFTEGLAKLDMSLLDPLVPWQFWLRRPVSIRETKQPKNGVAKGRNDD